MQIGDLLTHDGRTYIVRGFDPYGVRPRSIYLEDTITGARAVLPLDDPDRTVERTRGGLHLVEESDSTEPREDHE